MSMKIIAEKAIIASVTPSTRNPGTMYLDVLTVEGDKFNCSTKELSPDAVPALVFRPGYLEADLRIGSYEGRPIFELKNVRFRPVVDPVPAGTK